MLLKALLLGALAGFGMWDGRVAGQTMFERPLVLGPIVGLILGDIQTGITMGAAVELVMMGAVGIGAAVPPEVVCGGILSTAFAIMSGLDTGTAVALSLPIATLGQLLGILDRTLNLGFCRLADRAAEKGDERGISRALWGGAALFWFTSFLVVFLGVMLGSQVISDFVDWLPNQLLHGFEVASGMLPALGIAILMSLIFDKANAAYLFVGFVLTALLSVSTTGVAIVGAIIAYVVYQTSVKHKEELAGLTVTAQSIDSDDLDGEL